MIENANIFENEIVIFPFVTVLKGWSARCHLPDLNTGHEVCTIC